MVVTIVVLAQIVLHVRSAGANRERSLESAQRTLIARDVGCGRTATVTENF